MVRRASGGVDSRCTIRPESGGAGMDGERRIESGADATVRTRDKVARFKSMSFSDV